MKYSIKFYPEKRKKKGIIQKSNAPVSMYISYSGKRFQYYTGLHVDHDKWEDVKRDKQGTPILVAGKEIIVQRMKKRYLEAQDTNNEIDRLKAKVDEIFSYAKATGDTITNQYLRQKIKGKSDIKAGNPFFDVFDEFVRSEAIKNNWAKGTIKRWTVVKNHLQRLSKLKGYKLEFDSINDTFFELYLNYHVKTCKHLNSYTAKNIRLIKWFLNWCVKKGYTDNIDYKGFRFRAKDTGTGHTSRKFVLKWDELMFLYNLKIDKAYIERVRDIFCFQCFTGLRYIDVFNLKKSDIYNDTIHVITIKTGYPLEIPLNNFSKKILNRYSNMPGELALPVISNQKMNMYLKELGRLKAMEELEGWGQPFTVIRYRGSERVETTYNKYELLATHAGRRTFVTAAFYLGLKPEIIQSFTGHTSSEMLDIYNVIMEDHRKKEMLKFNRIGYMTGAN